MGAEIIKMTVCYDSVFNTMLCFCCTMFWLHNLADYHFIIFHYPTVQ